MQSDSPVTMVTLDEVTQGYIAEVRGLMEDARRKASEPFIPRLQAAVELFTRRQDLKGDWKLSPEGNSIISVETGER